MAGEHISGVVDLQRECFPPPFPEDLLWKANHLSRHLDLFPEGQFVALAGDFVVASASSTRISEENWLSHRSWEETVGGPMLETFDAEGTTIYGLDISVHPKFRSMGIGRMLYGRRFELVRKLGLRRYGTACRLPDYSSYCLSHPGVSVEKYAATVALGSANDRTMTPLLRYGLCFERVVHHYMDDPESGDSAALLSWTP